jgi:hypothetical protein
MTPTRCSRHRRQVDLSQSGVQHQRTAIRQAPMPVVLPAAGSPKTYSVTQIAIERGGSTSAGERQRATRWAVS